jgi:hypothetical protein
MDRCQEIKANVKMEECYAGMSLTFQNKETLREEIESAIEKIKKETGMQPLIFDSSKDQTEEVQAFYIEFGDEVQRESGAFFERLLKELKIDKCENDVIKKGE